MSQRGGPDLNNHEEPPCDVGPSYDEWLDNDDYSNGYEVLEVHGEPLVAICRSLFLTTPVPSQRHNILQTKCFIKGEVCSLHCDH